MIEITDDISDDLIKKGKMKDIVQKEKQSRSRDRRRREHAR